MSQCPQTLEMIGTLIAEPSVSSPRAERDMGNRAVIDHLANWLEGCGFAVTVQPLNAAGSKANLIASIGPGDGGLLLSGHTDTVPCDEARWLSDPFVLTERDGLLYGLGTADMKAFLAMAVTAASEFDAGKLKRPLTLLATADEESSMAGAKALADADSLRARYAVIGEPTGLKPVHTHKGIFMEAIHVQGQSGHSSDPALGASALEAMQRVIADLQLWREQLQAKHSNSLFAVPVPTLNLGHIHGGDSPNRICGDCELHIDLRPLPGMDINELREELHRRVRNLFPEEAVSVSFTTLFDGIPAMHTDPDSAIVVAAARLSGALPQAVSFGTEAPYLNALGMETVVMGPGDIAQAHQPDEYLRADQIEPTIDLLGALIRQFCVD